MTLLVATRNPGKARELRELLAPEGIEVLGLAGMPGAPEVTEDGSTFRDNARKKARALAEWAGVPVLADDSGLEVEALGGRPGVLSARYAGPGSSDQDNNRRLLEELHGVPPERRGAAFVCAMALVVPGWEDTEAEGRLEGRILESPRGRGGFGYDPLFSVEGMDRTLAELEVGEKNRFSHRARALGALLPSLRALGRN
ncbi:MAG: XTP/dITP diphosphatase [Deferrisomatales bacterium]|nr:XTP/dITP diphosphatase [Deferrisomatales bacterium]